MKTILKFFLATGGSKMVVLDNNKRKEVYSKQDAAAQTNLNVTRIADSITD